MFSREENSKTANERMLERFIDSPCVTLFDDKAFPLKEPLGVVVIVLSPIRVENFQIRTWKGRETNM